MYERYIITFKPHVSDAAIEAYMENLERHGALVHQSYSPLLKGFSASIPDDLVYSLENSHLIDYVEPDQLVHIQPFVY